MLYLGEKEKQVLASLYKLEDCSVAKIAKDTLINRTTLYPILENLFEKGLVSKIKIENKTVYQPISSEDFKIWADRKEREFRNIDKRFKT
jgi:sugar-specific transcriptional regulator TrmB